MPFRNVFIANKASMRLKNNQLIVENGFDSFSFPVEDIKSIVVENQNTTLSAKLISALADEGVCVIICNDKHMPSCGLVPIASYHRQIKRINLQFSQSKPKLKRIWQEIVVSKIRNQSECLRINNIEGWEKLLVISKSVLSGDSSNREGYAANLYFKMLFGNDFTRDKETIINAALNYGYSVIRSFISKSIICEGLEPSFGIHHKNQLNQFNLSDDIIEPFRPVIDTFVYNNYKNWNDEFKTFQKAELVRLLNCKIIVNGNNCSLSKAIELLIQSVISSFEQETDSLKLPILVETDYFEYD